MVGRIWRGQFGIARWNLEEGPGSGCKRVELALVRPFPPLGFVSLFFAGFFLFCFSVAFFPPFRLCFLLSLLVACFRMWPQVAFSRSLVAVVLFAVLTHALLFVFVLLVLAVFLFGCLFSMCVVCFALSCHLLCFFLGVASPSSATNHFLLCAPLLLRFCFFCLLCFFSSLFLTKGGRTEARIPRCKAVGLVVFGWGFGFVSFLFVCFFFFCEL